MNFDLPIALWGPLAGSIYAVLCLIVGERFPFSDYNLYGGAASRDQAAVPIFLADGAEVPIHHFGRFSELVADEMYPEGFACSVEWIVREAQRWVEEHAATSGEAPGPHRVEWGFRILQFEDGKLSEETKIVQQGWAWSMT